MTNTISLTKADRFAQRAESVDKAFNRIEALTNIKRMTEFVASLRSADENKCRVEETRILEKKHERE